MDTILIPFVYRALMRAVERDCPGITVGQPPCICDAGSFGETLLDFFDGWQGDCQITFGEFATNSLVTSLS